MRVAGTQSRTTSGSISSTGTPSAEALFCSSTHRTSSLGGGVCACRACNLFAVESLTLFLSPLPESSSYRTCQKSALPFAWGRRPGEAVSAGAGRGGAGASRPPSTPGANLLPQPLPLPLPPRLSMARGQIRFRHGPRALEAERQ